MKIWNFYIYQKNLKLFNIEGIITKNVVDMDYMFSSCKNGEQIFHYFNIQKVIDLTKIFL